MKKADIVDKATRATELCDVQKGRPHTLGWLPARWWWRLRTFTRGLLKRPRTQCPQHTYYHIVRQKEFHKGRQVVTSEKLVRICKRTEWERCVREAGHPGDCCTGDLIWFRVIG
jgi:hypothetical protein